MGIADVQVAPVAAKLSEPAGRGDLAAQRSVRSLAEAASAAQEQEQRQVLGVAEPGGSLPVPQGWRSSGEPWFKFPATQTESALPNLWNTPECLPTQHIPGKQKSCNAGWTA